MERKENKENMLKTKSKRGLLSFFWSTYLFISPLSLEEK
jgi:hypothetical protein